MSFLLQGNGDKILQGNGDAILLNEAATSAGAIVTPLTVVEGYGYNTQRVSQVVAEVLETGTAEARVSQIVAEVLEGGSAAIRVSQIVVEVLTVSTVNAFTVDGVSRDILQHWSISEQLNERGTMRFGIKSMDASYRPGLREEVVFNWISILFFAGHIHHTEETALGNLGYGVVPIQTLCGATDYNALPDRRQVGLTLPAGTLKSMLELLDDYLTIYGVTLDPAQVNGPTIADDLVFTTGTLTAIFDKLSVITGYGWNISYDKVLSMFAPGTEAAPFDIVDNDSRVIGDVRVSPTTVEYGNYIIVKYTVPAETAFVYFFINNMPTDGTWFKVAGQTFTFKTVPVDPNDVQIEGTIAAQRGTVAAAIDPLDEVTGFDQGTRVDVYAAAPGLAGNNIQVESNDGNGGADFLWGVDGVPVASHLYYGTDAALTGSVTAEDVPAQEGGANLYEKTYEEPTAESEETAQALADGYLVQSLVQPREIRYRTRLHGIHPGQQQSIQVTGRNIGAGSPPGSACLITQVQISPEGSALYNYDITAVEGLIIVPSHQDGWRDMAGRAVSGN